MKRFIALGLALSFVLCCGCASRQGSFTRSSQAVEAMAGVPEPVAPSSSVAPSIAPLPSAELPAVPPPENESSAVAEVPPETPPPAAPASSKAEPELADPVALPTAESLAPPPVASSAAPAARTEGGQPLRGGVNSTVILQAAAEAPAPAVPAAPPVSQAPAQSVPVAAPSDELRAVWLSYLEFLGHAQGKSAAEFTANMTRVLDSVAADGFNTVFMHLRPFGDALYASELFPWSYVLTGEEGKTPDYDPLAVVLSLAHARGIRVEGWFNPFRIRASKTVPISADNPALHLQAQGGDAVLKNGDGLYYNPANDAARELIIDGVLEVVERYDIDGVHFDDYFYPTTAPAFDAVSYNRYTAAGGRLALADWRRENVNRFVREAYAAVKAANPACSFGISPMGRIDLNYDGQFADIYRWCSTPGYLDYICPQIYYGFENASTPYEQTLASWEELITLDSVRLYVGLAAYKCGALDSAAGTGANEWRQNVDLLARMTLTARRSPSYSGVAVYRYDSLYEPQAAVSAHVARERAALCALFE